MQEQNSMRAVAYLRCSTGEQADSGLGLDAQRAKLTDESEHRGWSLRVIQDPGYTACDMARPGIHEALRMLEAGEADVLMVSRLDRLSRSLLDFAQIMELSRKQGWSIVLLDLQVDTTTAAGEMLANILASFAQFERRLISERTTEALAVLKAQGVQLGRPERVAPELCERIRRERDLGYSFRRIARNLTLDGVPTVQGGTQWWASTVQGALRRC